VVGFLESGEPLVGQIAKRQPSPTLRAPSTPSSADGRKFSDPRSAATADLPYSVVAADNGDAWVRVRERDYAPAQISALILEKMKKTAETTSARP